MIQHAILITALNFLKIIIEIINVIANFIIDVIEAIALIKLSRIKKIYLLNSWCLLGLILPHLHFIIQVHLNII